jgi:1-acyl-sn-glycerol-3-phosphate acyltransferase
MNRPAAGLPTHRGAVVAQRLGYGLIRALWSVQVRGVDHVPTHGAVILAPNHLGFLDPPLLVAACPRPTHTLGKKELFHGPAGWFLQAVGTIPVDRQDPSRSALRAAVGVLEAGRVLVVFPEGTRGSGDFSVMRTGLAWFALRTGAPVVPVVFAGTGSRGRTLGSLPKLRSRLDVNFGPPVTLPKGEGRTRTALDAATRRLQQALVAHREAAAAASEEST